MHIMATGYDPTKRAAEEIVDAFPDFDGDGGEYKAALKVLGVALTVLVKHDFLDKGIAKALESAITGEARRRSYST